MKEREMKKNPRSEKERKNPENRKNLLLVCLCLSLQVFPCFSQNYSSPKSAKDCFDEGVRAERNENWYLASQHFLEAINKNPSYGEAWLSLSGCSYMLGEYDLVLSQLSEAEKYLRDDSRVENLRGMTFIALERFGEARTVFEKILEKSPNNVDARFGLAELDLFDGRISAAESQYTEALKRQANSRKALLSLAVVSAQKGNFENARHFIENAVGYYSGEAEVHYLAAIVASMKGDVAGCERQARIAVQLNGNYDSAYELLSKALYSQGKYDEVISICDFRISRNRNLSSAWYLKGEAQSALGEHSAAVETWSQGLRIVPGDEIMRAALELSVNEYVPLEDTRRAEWAEYHISLAKEAQSRYDSSAVAWEYQRALKIHPSNEEARLSYAALLELNGMHELYLEQLLFIRENMISSETSENLESSESGNGSKTFEQVKMDDTIEAYTDILRDSLSRKWNVRPFYLDKTRWNIGIYYTPSSVHQNHVEGNRIAAEYASDVFSGIAEASVRSRAVSADAFGDAYQNARENGMDYFIILSQDEGRRDITLTYKFYSGRTGYLIAENSLYGTGNSRHSLVFRRFRNEILSMLPVKGKIIARNGKTLLSDLGRSENAREGAVFDIVRKGALQASGTSSGVVYKSDDILGTFTVTSSSEEVSEGRLEYKGFYDRVNVQDEIVLVSLPESDSSEAASSSPFENAPGADASGQSLNGNPVALTAEDLGIRRTPSFVDIIRSIY